MNIEIGTLVLEGEELAPGVVYCRNFAEQTGLDANALWEASLPGTIGYIPRDAPFHMYKGRPFNHYLSSVFRCTVSIFV